MSEEQNFQVGDRVMAFGCEGEVKSIHPYLRVIFYDGGQEFFLQDGKHQGWHKVPSLTLIERPKKKVQKTIWVNWYGCSSGSWACKSEEEAKRICQEGGQTCKAVIEVEE